MLLELGGREWVARRLHGRWRLSRHYTRRMADVEATHAADPLLLAYRNAQLRYAALPGGRQGLWWCVQAVRGLVEAG